MAVATLYKTDIELLIDYCTSVKDEIIELATSKGMNASGKTLNSLEIVERPTGVDIYAAENITVLEDGRKPTTEGASAGNPNLVDIIQEWINTKGVTGDDGKPLNAFAVAKTIHEKGTKLFRAGGNSGVLSTPLNLDKLEEVFNEMTLYWLVKASSDIYEPIKSLMTNK